MTGAGRPPYPEIVLRTTAWGVLGSYWLGNVGWTVVAVAGAAWWWLAGSYAGVGIAAVAGWFAFGGWVAMVVHLVHISIRRRPVLVLGPYGVTLRTRPREIPYDRVRLILTWHLEDRSDEAGPFYYLAVVPVEAIPAVYAAPRPRMPSIFGPQAMSGAPLVLDAWTVKIPGILVHRRREIVAELSRRCPSARVEDLGSLPYA